MQFTPNQRFYEFLDFLKQHMLDHPRPPAAETNEYRAFIEKFPPSRLTSLSLQEYCIGNGTNDSFCWWLERGLQKILGRYVPGNASGHILYFAQDGHLAKLRRLKHLSDAAALKYTLTMQAAIANASLQDALWIDERQEIYRRTGLEHLGTMAAGRKLRLLSSYHPNDLLPLSSSAHVGHFLTVFGCPKDVLPKGDQPVARLLLLSGLYQEAKKFIPKLAPNQMMWVMYDADFGIAPTKDDGSEEIINEVGIVGKLEMPSGNGPLVTVDFDNRMTLANNNLNLILAGPPGTGKTFATIDEAIKIIAPYFYEDNQNEREVLKNHFDGLVGEGQIRFTTFHQSFSYEDFVEGLRAETDDDSGHISYTVEPGIFQQICTSALPVPVATSGGDVKSNPRLWKISIVGSRDSSTRKYCFDNGQARIGWGETGDLRHADLDLPVYNLGSNDKSCLRNFSQDIQIGDILLCLASNSQICGVGVVQSEYFFDPDPPVEIEDGNYKHVLNVNWLLRDIRFPILELNANKPLALKTVYELWRIKWPELLQALQSAGFDLPSQQVKLKTEDDQKKYVLIIDEINRGNVSRIFGELITLIEPSKRAGAAEALPVILPYSKKTFSVPKNVYLIGTMNTADRSLTGIDIALRRRFQFKEMLPDLTKLGDVQIDGIPLAGMLKSINDRIEVLLGRDFCLGHAYFMELKTRGSLGKLAEIFQYKILPLLQEYFFEDWQRIAWVLNDQHKPVTEAFVFKEVKDVRAIFGGSEDIAVQSMPWRINEKAFLNVRSYLGIIEKQKSS